MLNSFKVGWGRVDQVNFICYKNQMAQHKNLMPQQRHLFSNHFCTLVLFRILKLSKFNKFK